MLRLDYKRVCFRRIGWIRYRFLRFRLEPGATRWTILGNVCQDWSSYQWYRSARIIPIRSNNFRELLFKFIPFLLSCCRCNIYGLLLFGEFEDLWANGSGQMRQGIFIIGFIGAWRIAPRDKQFIPSKLVNRSIPNQQSL